MNYQANSEIIAGRPEQCANTTLTLNDLLGDHQLPGQNFNLSPASTQITPHKCHRCRALHTGAFSNCDPCREYLKSWRQTPWGIKTVKARSLAANCQTSGQLVPLPCEVCGDPETEKHHENYDHPFDVRWLCYEHHRMVTAGEIKLAYREPQVFHRSDRKTVLAIGKIARNIVKGLTSEQLTELQDGIRSNRRVLIQEANGIFVGKDSNG